MEPQNCCSEEKFELRDVQGKELVRFCSILHIDGADKYVNVFLDGADLKSPVRKVNQSGSIGKFYKRLEHTGMFCLVHKSYIVNIKRIKKVLNAHTLLMDDGAHIPVSKKHQQALQAMLKSC